MACVPQERRKHPGTHTLSLSLSHTHTHTHTHTGFYPVNEQASQSHLEAFTCQWINKAVISKENSATCWRPTPWTRTIMGCCGKHLSMQRLCVKGLARRQDVCVWDGEEVFFMWATRVTMCVAWLPFVKRLTEHMCWYCVRVCVCVCVCVRACVCEPHRVSVCTQRGSNCVSWGPPGSTVQILGPEQLAWGLERVLGGGGVWKGSGGLWV